MNYKTIKKKKIERIGGPKDVGSLRASFAEWKHGYIVINNRHRQIRKAYIQKEMSS